MSTDFERFVAGEGRLAGALRAQPAYEPPPHMEARLFAALDSLDADGASAGFEPPPALEAAVMAQAARIDAAQRPRREALLSAVARGDDPDAAALGPAAQRWLRAQVPTGPAPPAAKPAQARRRPWLAGLGSAFAALIALGVAVQLWFDPQARQAAQEVDKRTAAADAPARPAPSPPAETRPRQEAKRDGFSRERGEPARHPPATATLGHSAETLGGMAAPMAKAIPAPSVADVAPARVREHAPREVSRDDFAERAAREAPRAPSATLASPPTRQSAEPSGGASAPFDESAGSAPAETNDVAPLTRMIAPESDTARQGRAEESAVRDAIRFLVPLTTSAPDLATRIAAYPAGRWQISVAPADRPAAQRLIGAAARQLAAKGRRDRFVLVDASRTAGTLRVEPIP